MERPDVEALAEYETNRAEAGTEYDAAVLVLADYITHLEDRLSDAATVIERMANGASRRACSPELDRVIEAVNALPGHSRPEGDA